MIQWLKAQLPHARHARATATRQAAVQRNRAARDADHQVWLATLPAELRAHPQLQTHREQADARAWADLTPASDRAHAIQRHLRWTMAPPAPPQGVTMATKIALLIFISRRMWRRALTVSLIGAG